MKKKWFMLCLTGAILLCAGCKNTETPPEAPPPGGTQETADETDRAVVYSDEEITITVPVAYKDSVQVDTVGSDNLFVVSANLYYAPEYTEGEFDGDTPTLCGGWMLTVEQTTALAARGMAQSDSFFATCWTGDGQSIYYENRPKAEELENASPEFLAVLGSIQVDYGDLKPVADADTAPSP